MQGISDIRIKGVDSKRPPVISKAPYLDLYFELSHKVPRDWVEDFNTSMSKHKFPAKVNAGEGLFIEAWVRKPEEIAELFTLLKTRVSECNDRCVARIQRSSGKQDDANKALGGVGGEQGRLNQIVAGLDFGE